MTKVNLSLLETLTTFEKEGWDDKVSSADRHLAFVNGGYKCCACGVEPAQPAFNNLKVALNRGVSEPVEVAMKDLAVVCSHCYDLIRISEELSEQGSSLTEQSLKSLAN